MSENTRDRLRTALEEANLELDEEQLDEVAGGLRLSCDESCYEQCSACCYNGSANRLASATPSIGAA